jgi:hypothetical protein
LPHRRSEGLPSGQPPFLGITVCCITPHKGETVWDTLSLSEANITFIIPPNHFDKYGGFVETANSVAELGTSCDFACPQG